MTISDLGALGEFVSGLGVILSLLYLAIQVRHGTREVRANTSQLIMSSSINNRADVANGPLAPVVWKQMRGERLDEEELARFSFFHQLQTDIFQTAFIQHRDGRLDEEMYRMIERRAMAAFQSNLWVSFWNSYKDGYLEDFVTHVAELLETTESA